MNRLLSLLIPALLLLAACEKDPRYRSPQKFLSQAPWKLATSRAITIRTGQAADTMDYYAQLDSCRQDQRYVYAESGSYYSEPGTKVCPGQQPLQREDLGRWQYFPETKQLLIDGAGRLTWDVLQLDDSVLNLRLRSTVQNDSQASTRIEEQAYVHP
ncbi:MAG: hypothetical protein EOP52_02865 [Sphingobacteriales bacterium]|nr:MAG: hypothetical protein EOP52_02865 [Sphingobacteriales bacterium]